MVALGGACMVDPWGVVHGCSQGHVWLLGGHVWLLLGGMCGCSGGMRGCSKGACTGYDEIRRYDQ